MKKAIVIITSLLLTTMVSSPEVKPQKYKQGIVKTEREFFPAITIEDKQIVIVDRIEGSQAIIEFPDRTMKDIALNVLPKGITRSDALIYSNGTYTAAPIETAKRKIIIEEKMRDMFI